MDKGDLRWVRVVQSDDNAVAYSRLRLALAVTPPELARGIASLIKVSDEYRDVGLLVTNVGPNSPALAAGIERGDMLLRYDGVPVESAVRLMSLEEEPAQGNRLSPVTVDAVRGARELTFSVPPGRLGVTVSPCLHRLGPSRRRIVDVTRASGLDQGEEQAAIADPTVVDVPSDLVPQVQLLAAVLQGGTAKQRKKAKDLVLAAAGLG